MGNIFAECNRDNWHERIKCQVSHRSSTVIDIAMPPFIKYFGTLHVYIIVQQKSTRFKAQVLVPTHTHTRFCNVRAMLDKSNSLAAHQVL